MDVIIQLNKKLKDI